MGNERSKKTIKAKGVRDAKAPIEMAAENHPRELYENPNREVPSSSP
jgi:hypothetical protein